MPRKAARLRYLRAAVGRAAEDPGALPHPHQLRPGAGRGHRHRRRGRPEAPAAVATTLWDTARIIVTPIVHDEFHGVRVTPNLYTTLDEVDTFAAAMERLKPADAPARTAG